HARDLVDHAQLQMILQVLPDARPVEHDRDTEIEQIAPRPDAGEQQQLPRADRAGRENDLAPGARGLARAVLAPGHAGRAPAVELDALGEAAGFDPKVRPVEHRLPKSARRRPAPPAPLVDVEITGAFVVAAIEIVDRRDAVLLRRLAKRVEQFPLHARRLDAPFAADAMVLAFAEKMIGLLLEQRQ